MKKTVLLFLSLLSMAYVHAQHAQIKGFVVDASNGQAVIAASVWLEGTQRGTATNATGFFQIPNIAPGEWILHIRFVGYEEYMLTLTLQDQDSKQFLIQLKPQTIQLGEARISGKRRIWEQTNTVSVHKLTPATIQKIPSISGTPDLGEYLQVLPGIIFTGDQGGQFYVRGGAPVHNLVKLDGMTVINPFHSIGFVSVFDTETFAGVDVYTAGFSSPYGGRLSSVIDIRTRPANRRQVAGTLNLTNFGYGVTLDVPLVKMKTDDPRSVSILLSNKNSYIDQIDDAIYPHLGKHGIPYEYNDLYGKISMLSRRGDQLEVMGMKISDRAWFGETMESNWVNGAGGIRWITAPSSSQWLYQASSYYSDYQGSFDEKDQRTRKTRFNSLENQMKVWRSGDRMDWDIGLSMNIYNSIHSFQGIQGITEEWEYFTTELVTYVDNITRLGKWLIEPGIHLVYYADQTFISPEPRLKIKYALSEAISLNMATGMYSQNLMSANSDRDVVSLFQGYYMGPDLVQDYFHGDYIIDKVQQAWHAVMGINLLTKKDIRITLEGYVKNFTRLVSFNRNKIFQDSDFTRHLPEYLRSYFLLEKGYAYGTDFLLDYTHEDLSIWVGYSLAWVFREDEQLQYVPHYDRRHNLNLLVGYPFGKNKNWNLKARWNLGSGFPFTQTNGVYEDMALNYGSYNMDFAANSQLMAWYADLNQGRLPWYHRLDVTLNRNFDFGHNLKLELSAGVINAYNRRNMFYINRLTYEKIDQFPILPHVSVLFRFL